MTSAISRITLATVCISSLMSASDKPLKIAAANLYANTRKDNVLLHKDGFSVNGQRVQDADLSKDLRGISKKALKRFFEKDRSLQVSRIGNDYRIDTRERLKAGGPAFGAFMYWATKTVCYGVIGGGMAAGGAAVATVAAPVIGATAALATGGAIGTVGGMTVPALTAATTSLGSMAAAAPIGAIATVVAADASLATAAVIGTAEVATTMAATGGVVAAVETFSAAVGLFFGMTPTV